MIINFQKWVYKGMGVFFLLETFCLGGAAKHTTNFLFPRAIVVICICPAYRVIMA